MHHSAVQQGWLWGNGWMFFLAMVALLAVALLMLSQGYRPALERKRIPPPQQRRRSRRY